VVKLLTIRVDAINAEAEVDVGNAAYYHHQLIPLKIKRHHVRQQIKGTNSQQAARSTIYYIN
jgi:hypothetical protein